MDTRQGVCWEEQWKLISLVPSLPWEIVIGIKLHSGKLLEIASIIWLRCGDSTQDERVSLTPTNAVEPSLLTATITTAPHLLPAHLLISPDCLGLGHVRGWVLFIPEARQLLRWVRSPPCLDCLERGRSHTSDILTSQHHTLPIGAFGWPASLMVEGSHGWDREVDPVCGLWAPGVSCRVAKDTVSSDAWENI